MATIPWLNQDVFDQDLNTMEAENSEGVIDEYPTPMFPHMFLRPELVDDVKKIQTKNKRWSRQFKTLWTLKPNFPVNALPEYRSKQKRWSRDIQNKWGLKLNFPVAWLPRYRYNGYATKEKKMKENENDFEPDMDASDINSGLKRSVPYYLVH